MLRAYDDIRSRIAEPPKWWDEQGVPRWSDFQPEECGVYDDIVILGEIACQDCGERFLVANTSDMTARLKAHWMDVGLTVLCDKEPSREAPAVDVLKEAQGFCFGDPPIHGCVGDTMGSDYVRVVEVWDRRNDRMTWKRRQDIEEAVNAGGVPA